MSQTAAIAFLLLATVWCTAFMVCADAAIDLRRIRRWIRPAWGLPPSSKAELRWVECRAEGSQAIAQHRLTQILRPLDGPAPRFGAFDSRRESEVLGGTLLLPSGESVQLGSTSGERCEVWPDRDRQAAVVQAHLAGLGPSEWNQWTPARGKMATSTVDLGTSETLYVRARFAREADQWTAEAPSDEPLVVSQIDPRTWGRQRALTILGLQLLSLAWAAAGTWLCFLGEPWGLGAKLGALVLLGLLLGLTPIASAIRAHCRTPAERPVEGVSQPGASLPAAQEAL